MRQQYSEYDRNVKTFFKNEGQKFNKTFRNCLDLVNMENTLLAL